MSGRVLRFDDSAHREMDALLPWLVNGTLAGDELAAAQEHLRDCARCRREVELLQQLDAFCAIDQPAPDSSPAYRRLAASIDSQWWGRRFGRRSVNSLVRLVRPWGHAPAWTRWAIAAQFAVIVGAGLFFAVHDADSPAIYQSLGAPATRAAPAGAIAVVFDSALKESELRRILRTAGARVVDGPTESNAYVLQIGDGHRDAALAALRNEPGVRLAQPLSAAADR